LLADVFREGIFSLHHAEKLHFKGTDRQIKNPTEYKIQRSNRGEEKEKKKIS